jgi:hypothetical protein
VAAAHAGARSLDELRADAAAGAASAHERGGSQLGVGEDARAGAKS